MKKIVSISILSLVFSFVLISLANAASCRLVGGKTYYTDGVSYFKDNACRQESTVAELESSGNASAAALVTVVGSSPNCHYNSTIRQFTDGTAYFLDNKCSREAINGETVELAAAALNAVSSTVAISNNTQFTQLAQRISALEKKVAALQTILAQILAIIKNK